MVQGNGGYIEVVDRFGRSLEFVPVYSTNIDKVYEALLVKYGSIKGVYGFHYYYLRSCETFSDLTFYLESDDEQFTASVGSSSLTIDDLR